MQKVLKLSAKESNLYRLANQDWTTLAFHHPLVFKPKGTKIHFVGIHHDSPASVDRVQECISKLQPEAVFIELHKDSFASVERKFNYRVQLVSGTKMLKSVEDDDRIKLDAYGLSNFYRGKSENTYGKELATAVATCQNLDINASLIDESVSSILQMIESSKENDLKHSLQLFKQTKFNYFQNTTALGEMIYKFLHWYIFGRKDMKTIIERDLVGIGELETFMRLWSYFHPSLYFREIKSRDLIMSYRIIQELNRNDYKRVVVVVGKGHIVGIQQLFHRYFYLNKYTK